MDEICERLIQERYDDVYLHFEGRAAVRADLLYICRKVRSGAKLQVASSNSAKGIGRSALPSARRFELKAAECHQLAENAKHDEPRQIFTRLAETYEKLAAHARRTQDAPPDQKPSEQSG